MKNETKNALYSLLDFIDSIGTISFVNLDLDTVNLIRNEILNLINGNSINQQTLYDSNEQDLLGILPMILLDDSKFSSAREVLIFAEKCLKIQVKQYWYKRSKSEVVGIVLNEVSKQSAKQRNRFLKAWGIFQNQSINNINKNNNAEDNNDFVDTWFKFFDNYKEIK